MMTTEKTTFKENLTNFFYSYGAQLSLAPALVALFGSLYYSEIAGFIPCELCWYQRILMYPLSVIIIVGVFKRDELLPKYVLPFSIVGMAVSTYHVMLQNKVVGGAGVCTGGVSCASRYVNLFGFVTIPFMAGIAFFLITILLLGVNWAYKLVDEE